MSELDINIASKPSDLATPELREIEIRVIELFVRGVKVLGLPKSVGEIYGLLYVSPDPLPLDTLVARLQMSKGSASQGLKFLRNLGAVKSIYVGGDRRDHYEAQTELKALVAGFLKEELLPHFQRGSERLGRLEELVESDASEDAEFYRQRLGKLNNWRTRSNEMMELVQGMLD